MTDLRNQPASQHEPQESQERQESAAPAPAPAALPLLAALGGVTVALVAAGSLLGLWYLPFPCGLLIGAVTAARGLRARTAVLTGTAAALAGWGVPLLWRAATGEAVAGTARTVAALAGLPAWASLVIAITLLIGLVQALLGVWLGRTATAALRPTR
ncbi:hypothetical protein ATKI12_6833 [Kitasatospora sp. Ki12]